MKKVLVVLTILSFGLLIGRLTSPVEVKAASVIGVQYATGDHTTCELETGVPTKYCFANDGIWWSKAGAAYVLYGQTQTISFSQITGRLAPAQLPATTSFDLTGNLTNTINTATLANPR